MRDYLKHKFFDLLDTIETRAEPVTARGASFVIGILGVVGSFLYTWKETGDRRAAYFEGIIITALTTLAGAVIGDKLSDGRYNKAKLFTIIGALVGAIGGNVLTHYTMHNFAKEEKMPDPLPKEQGLLNPKRERPPIRDSFNSDMVQQKIFAFGNTTYDPAKNTVVVKPTAELTLS